MNEISTLKELLQKSTEEYKSNTAFFLKDKGGAIYEISYDTFGNDCACLAAALAYELGARDKSIGVFMANRYEWCVSYLAVAACVGTVVPLDRELPCRELYNIIDFAGIEVIITDSCGYQTLSQDGEKMRQLKIITVEKENTGDCHCFGELLVKGKEHIASGKDVSGQSVAYPEQTAALLFTSGTTGMTKGVMLSNKNLCSDMNAVKKVVTIRQDDVALSLLPLHHTYEAMAFLMIISSGAAIGFCEGLRHLRENFREYRPTVFVTVPLLLEGMHKSIREKTEKEGKGNAARLMGKVSAVLPEESRKRIFSGIHEFFGGRLRLIICGAAALRKQVAKDFFAYGIPVIIGYGLTECSPIVICNSEAEPTADTVGKPLPGVQVRILSPDENGIGEIAVKGPMVMKGYYKNQLQTRQAIVDGWLHTGDLGFEDKNGNYHITGRSKNVIVTANGKNVYPEELEYYLSMEGAVGECIVYCEGDDIISAEILPDGDYIRKKLKKDSVSDEEIHALVKEAVRGVNRSLPGYKRIRRVTIRNKPFDKTTTHKIKR